MQPAELERFKRAQDNASGGYKSALGELRAGAKRSHWIWYVFPQLQGLGNSAMAREFAIRDFSEAIQYAKDPVLAARLVESSQVVAAQLKAGVPLKALMGSQIDALKLVSSLTLFEKVAERLFEADGNLDPQTLLRVTTEILTIAEAQGYPRCSYTLAQLQTISSSSS